MTLTPAIREALDDLRERIVLHNYVECQENCTSLELRHHKELVAKAETLLLSVVAAEEGRKYEQLVKLHREWVEARKAFDYAMTLRPVEPYVNDDLEVWEAVESKAVTRISSAVAALAQWEAL